MQYTISLKKKLILLGMLSSIMSITLKIAPPGLAPNKVVNPKSRAPFFIDTAISLFKDMTPIIVDKLTFTDGQYSNVIGGCITQLREKKNEYLTAIRQFWENMRNIYDKNDTWKNDFWKNLSDNLAKFNLPNEKSFINCSKLFGNLKAADEKKILDVLGKAEYFGGFTKQASAAQSHMITGIIGTRRSRLDKHAFKRINDISRGKAL